MGPDDAHGQQPPSPLAGGAEAEGALPLLAPDLCVYERYLSVYGRRVGYPGGGEVAFDVVGHPRCAFRFVTVFPWDRERKEVTLVREFAQGPNASVWSLPTGGFSEAAHGALGEGGLLAAARAELAEEARLEGGAWHCLLPDGHGGLSEGKWCLNRFVPFVVSGARPMAAAEAPMRDAEEELMEVHTVSLERLESILFGAPGQGGDAAGEMLPPSAVTCHRALRWLRQQGQI